MLSDTPEYSVDGLIGVSIVNSEWANAIFYCEDSGYEAVYERLIKRLCPELNKFIVACTGGKTVTQKLAERREDIALPYILLVDKDYDDLNGFLEKRLDLGMSYLRRYSIENYISQIEPLMEIALETLSKDKAGLTKANLEKKTSDREEYIASLSSSLENISKFFVLCQRHRISIRTCKTPGSDLFHSESDQYPLPGVWFENFKGTLDERIEVDSDWMLQEGWMERELSTAFNAQCEPWGKLEPAAHIVGKHLLFGLLTYLDSRLGTGFREMSTRELCLRIISHAKLDELEYLRAEILEKLSVSPTFVAVS